MNCWDASHGGMHCGLVLMEAVAVLGVLLFAFVLWHSVLGLTLVNYYLLFH